ncbi:hypothetical protein FACS189472_10440 [Alphaproteobacteria bacterium]|nr:hypothetical protein FACS1894122_15260 [Alphaproteobacteria bacterium]GHU19931.1 hypothetical protein FACS189472_10440 [Alphaproteobacteria bacterium]
MWQAVLELAIKDTTDKKLRRVARRKAQNWFNTPYFSVVCDRAGVDADATRKKVLEKIKM